MDHVNDPYSSSRSISSQGYLPNGGDLGGFTVDDSNGGDMMWDMSVDPLPPQTFLPQSDYTQNANFNQPYPSLYEAPQNYNSQFAHDAARFQNAPFNFQSYSPAPVSYGQPELATHTPPVSQHPLQGYQMLQDPSHRTFSPAQPQHQQAPVITQQQYDPELQQQWGAPAPARPLYSPHPAQQHQHSPPQKSPVPVQQATNDNVNLFAQMPASFHISNLQPRPISTPEPKPQPRLNPYPILPVEPTPIPVPDAKPQPAAEVSQPSRVPINPVPRQISPAPKDTLLRITNADLLTKFGEGSLERLAAAPFLVMTGEPVNLEIKGKTTIPKYHPRGNRSGKPVAGHQLSIAAAPAKATRALKPKPAARKYRGTKDAGPTDVKLRVPRTTNIVGPKAVVASPETSSEEDSSSAAEYTSDEEDEVLVIDKIEDHRPATRPIGIAEAAGYDAVGLVWIERHRHPNVEEISKAIQSFQDFIGGLREDIKKVTLDITKAENEKKTAEVKKLTANREIKRSAMTLALKAAKEHGHQDVLQNLSNSQRVVVALSMTLIDCVKAEDYGGALPRAVLELMTEFKTLTDELLKRAKFDSVQKRFSKKGDDSIKELLSIIAKNTLAYEAKLKKMKGEIDPLASKSAVEDGKPQEQKKASGEVSSITSNLKRAHPGDSASAQPAKKPTPSAKGTALKPAQPATKVSSTPARPSNIFASLTKPGTKSAAAAAAAAKLKQLPKKEALPSAPPPSALAAILASIEKPKELPKAPATPERAPETPEEKAKRERKESRRHLRVKFREGDELEQIRLFQHEQAEDEGRQEEMVRDAHDERSEGMMHKQRASETKQDPDAMDEDDDLSAEVEFRPYPSLIGIDFSALEPSVLEKSFTSRGGNKTIITPQQAAQGKREANELMAFYTADSDIPVSAKEPSNPYSGDAREEVAIAQPNDPKLVQRIQEIQLYGAERALIGFAARQAEQRARANHNTNFIQTNTANSADISAILAAMNGSQQQPQQPQQPQSSAAMYGQQQVAMPKSATPPAIDWDVIRRAITMTQGKPYPATEPPEWMTERGKSEWWDGYNRDNAQTSHKLAESQRAVAAEKAAQMFADHTQQTTQPQPAEAPQMQAYQQFPQISQIPGQDMDHQIQNLLAGMGAGQFPQPSAFQQGSNWWGQSNGGQYDNQAHAQNQNHNQSQGQAQNQPPVHPSRNWVGNDHSNSNYNASQNQNQNQNQNSRGWEEKYNNENANSFEDPSNTQNGNNRGEGGFKRGGKRKWTDDYKKGTKPCKYFAEGKCLKGDKCTYRHDISEGLYG